MTGNTWDIIKIQTKTNQLIMGNRTDQIWVRRRRQRKTKSDNLEDVNRFKQRKTAHMADFRLFKERPAVIAVIAH